MTGRSISTDSANSAVGGFAIDVPAPRVPEELVAACLAGECVLYAGAGVSAQSGLPTWGRLLGEMVDWAIHRNVVDERTGKSLRAALQVGEFDSVCEGLLDQLGDRLGELHAFLHDRLVGKAAPSVLHGLLHRLPFTAVLTTNFDILLQQTFQDRSPAVHTPRDTEKLLTALSSRAFFILKLYGDLQSVDTVILSAAQFQDSIGSNRAFSTFMETLFFSRTLLFVGARIEGIEDYLAGIKFSSSRPRTHYALVDVAASGPAWELKSNTLRRKYGIVVIPYAVTEGHPQVPQFVRELVDAVENASRQQQANSNTTTPPQVNGALTRLVLDNIGPFDHLELDFSTGWNVLLGDNGIGKSNILKAIALSVCGRDAEAYANRLIRSGQSHGSILLETDRGTIYKTNLFRGTSQAEVVCEPGRPLEAEGWLAVAFPPSRLLTWDRPKSPEASVVRRPTPEDLLPLISGGADPRIDKLKQWLVNIDYWIKTARERREDFTPYERLREEFFNVIGKVAAGTRVKYLGIEPRTNEVKVETDDGVIPLESISQGTASLLGWLGVLLQRLYETSPPDVSPLDRYALVLIDEIDAHMHPGWQHSLVDNLKDLFPNVQFIATTHSPLIVADLKAAEIYALSRSQDGSGSSKILVERPQSDPRGWYSDTVLTSDLFKLESTLPPRIARAVKHYTELAARDEAGLNAGERTEKEKLAQMLNIRMPAPHERKRAREAFEMLQSAMDDRLKEMPKEKQKELLQEASVQLQEIITQSRRP